MKALLFIRNSGTWYKNLRNELENDYTKGIDSYPHTVTDANHRLEYWKPLEVTGTTHLATTDQATQPKDNGAPKQSSPYQKICFKCDEEGHVAKECPNDKKKDGSPLNSTEEINKKFDEIMKKKEPAPEERDDSEKKSTAGTGMFVGGEIIPTYAEILAGEESEDDQCPGYTF